MKRILQIILGDSCLPVMAYKDMGMTLYTLGSNYGWSSQYGCFGVNDKKWSEDFLKHVDITIIGSKIDYKGSVEDTKLFIRNNAKNYDVIMFFNYGSTVYKLAKLCKKINPNITVYSKLDMGQGGFSHFSPKRNFSNLRSRFEAFKSRYIDFFTVETKEYYNTLKDTPMFKDRIYYLPNGVSTLMIPQ